MSDSGVTVRSMTGSAAHVVIMGGSSGIGLATARLLRADHRVTIAGRDRARLNEAAGSLGGRVGTMLVDAADRAALDAVFQKLEAVDHLVVAVTGARGGGPFTTLDLADVREGLAAKTLPHLNAAQAALPALAANGSLTFVTAVSAGMANPATAGLAVINAGIEAAARTLAVELAPVRVNAVSPGVIDTPWWDSAPPERRQAIFADVARRAPLGRVGTADEVAHAIRFLVTSTYVTGVVLPVDGGLRLRS
jgi:NAD(P)-dependent dehydrogenase (short-subunit alcohol dehydrogenase family)